MKPTILAALLLALLLFACGGSEDSGTDGDGDGDGAGGADGGYNGDPIEQPQDFCDVMAAQVCHKVMTCYTAQERLEQGLAADEAECLEREQEDCTLDTICAPDQDYDPAHAGGCVSEFEAMACDEYRSVEPELGPECSAVCQS